MVENAIIVLVGFTILLSVLVVSEFLAKRFGWE
jgi:hypothetical protein